MSSARRAYTRPRPPSPRQHVATVLPPPRRRGAQAQKRRVYVESEDSEEEEWRSHADSKDGLDFVHLRFSTVFASITAASDAPSSTRSSVSVSSPSIYSPFDADVALASASPCASPRSRQRPRRRSSGGQVKSPASMSRASSYQGTAQSPKSLASPRPRVASVAAKRRPTLVLPRRTRGRGSDRKDAAGRKHKVDVERTHHGAPVVRNDEGNIVDPLDSFFGLSPEAGKAMRCGYASLGIEEGIKHGWKGVEDFESLLRGCGAAGIGEDDAGGDDGQDRATRKHRPPPLTLDKSHVARASSVERCGETVTGQQTRELRPSRSLSVLHKLSSWRRRPAANAGS